MKDKIIEKKTLHRKFQESKNPYLYSQFKTVRSECKSLSYKDHEVYIEKTEKTLQKNPRKFFDYVRSKKQENGIPKTIHYENEFSNNGSDTANLFAKHFSSVYSKESLCSPHFAYDHFLSPTLSKLSVSEDDIFNKLSKLQRLTSHGPDGIPSYILRECAAQLVYPLTYLFNRSLHEGIFPNLWKISYVKPFHKNGDKTNVKNFRPISNLSVVPKVFESIIYDKIRDVLSHLVSDLQHGFVKHKSTLSNLVSFYEFLVSALEQGCQVDVMYSDFSKAFDKVNFNILIAKLQSLGISDPLLSWLYSYLTSRTQIVKVENFESDGINVTSGCPQGGHLSGFLFNFFINDLSFYHYEQSTVRKWFFADDYRVARIISSSTDCLDLQESLLELTDWCDLNRMQLNVEKCYVVSFHRKKCPILYNYQINNSILSRKTSIKDLGVYIDCDLKFTTHLDYITKKAYRNLGFVDRNSRYFKSPKTYKTLYCSIVRSSLEYCSTLWSPHYSTYIENIEKIQKKFLRSLGFKDSQISNNHDYKTIMDKYKINTLEHRRTIFDILFIIKIINSNIHCPELLEKLSFRCSTVQTRNNDIFRSKTMKNNIAKNAPMYRCMELCNLISNPPHNIDITSDSIQSIKTYMLNLLSLH